MIEIITPIPAEILSAGGGGGNYTLKDDSYDVALNGLPFMLATNDQRPYIREVQDIKKPMFDNFAEPGEYSMMEWWLRSQDDFGGGQGVLYQDPSVDLRFNIKYNSSTGINPWKPGEISLLPQAISDQDALITPGTISTVRGYFGGAYSLPRAWYSVGAKLYSYDVTLGTSTNILYSGADPEVNIVSITSVGNKYYVANATGIYSGTGTGAGTKLWNTGSSDTVIGWVKGRLMAGIDNKVYELVTGGPALPTPVFTHLDTAWNWSAITEGPTAIYFAGSAYPSSSIYKFVLETDGAVPTLASGGTVAAPMPPGEEVNSLYCYLGTFMGISTNRGFRVGNVETNGDVSYGPLLWEKQSYDITGDDRFFYVKVTNGIDLNPDNPDPAPSTFPDYAPDDTEVVDGIYRVDLGLAMQDQTGAAIRFAYSTDRFFEVLEDAGDPSQGNMRLRAFDSIGDRFLFGIYGSATLSGDDGYTALWPSDREEIEKVFPPASVAEPYTKMEEGFLQTGRVGFNTLEAKLFRFFSVRAPAPLEGNIDVDVIDDGGGVIRYITYTPARPPDVGDIPLSAIFEPKEYISLRLTLHRNGTDLTLGAIVGGWQIKALPAPIRQRVITMNLLCFDFQQDKTGQEVGYEGWALERIRAIEQLAQGGNSFLLQDLYNDVAAQVVIEQLQFAQYAPPGPTSSAYGGYLTVRLRTVSDVIG